MTTSQIEGYRYDTVLAFCHCERHAGGLLLTDTDFTVWTVDEDRRKARVKPIRSDATGILPAMGMSPFPELQIVDEVDGHTIRILGERGWGQYGLPAGAHRTVGDLTPNDIGREVRVEGSAVNATGTLYDVRTEVTWISDQTYGSDEGTRVAGPKTVEVEVGRTTVRGLPLDARVVFL